MEPSFFCRGLETGRVVRIVAPIRSLGAVRDRAVELAHEVGARRCTRLEGVLVLKGKIFEHWSVVPPRYVGYSLLADLKIARKTCYVNLSVENSNFHFQAKKGNLDQGVEGFVVTGSRVPLTAGESGVCRFSVGHFLLLRIDRDHLPWLGELSEASQLHEVDRRGLVRRASANLRSLRVLIGRTVGHQIPFIPLLFQARCAHLREP